MIEINLLPKELRVQKKGVTFSFQRWITIGFIVLLGVWLLVLLEAQYIRAQIERATQNWQGMQVTYGDTKELVDKINNKYKPMIELFDRYIRRRLSLAPALNIISDDLPENIWLTVLKAEEMSQSWILTLRGVARPFRQLSPVRIIGDYTSGLKNEFALIEQSTASPIKFRQKEASSEIEVTTTTKRKVAGHIEVTEFLGIFTRRRA